MRGTTGRLIEKFGRASRNIGLESGSDTEEDDGQIISDQHVTFGRLQVDDSSTPPFRWLLGDSEFSQFEKKR